MVEDRNADKRKDTKVRGIVNGTAETEDVALAYNDFWWDRGTKVIGTRRTSLIIDPAGRPVSADDPSGEEAAWRPTTQVSERPAEGPEDRSVGERCIMGFNSGPPMVARRLQPERPDLPASRLRRAAQRDMVDTNPHDQSSPARRQNRGLEPAPVGRRAGGAMGLCTLAIQSKNFARNTSLRGSSSGMRADRALQAGRRRQPARPSSTVDDPATWTKPWTAEVPMVKAEGQIQRVPPATTAMTGRSAS